MTKKGARNNENNLWSSLEQMNTGHTTKMCVSQSCPTLGYHGL